MSLPPTRECGTHMGGAPPLKGSVPIRALDLPNPREGLVKGLTGLRTDDSRSVAFMERKSF